MTKSGRVEIPKFPIFDGRVAIFCGLYGNFAKSENQAVIFLFFG